MRILIAAAALLLAAFQAPSPSPTPTPSPTATPSPSASPTPSAHPPAPDPATLANTEHGSRQPDRNPDNSAADTRDDQPPPHAQD
ncbi:hypothetical protein ACFSCW_16245 [Sphingomonas tabacisoli]|uniref:Uncharacterized protein n=1 Tax=Sphingomonas tabacisoli TaxID=2249466 RepID=A0ABW4I971_9SPHN